MDVEKRKEEIRRFKKQNNKQVLRKSRIPLILLLTGIGYIFLVERVLDFDSKWVSLPGIILMMVGLVSLKEIWNDWDKIPEFGDDAVLDEKMDKIISFFSGYIIAAPFFIILLMRLWTNNFFSESRFWITSTIFGIVFSTVLYNILKRKIPANKLYNKQRIEELGRIWFFLLLIGIMLFQGVILSFVSYRNGEVMVVRHNKETNEIYYKENWIAARYGRKAYTEIKDSDSIKVEVIPFIFGMEYFRNFSAIK